MSMEYIRKYYGVPAKRGGTVVMYPGEKGEKTGKILSAYGHYLRVRFDGDKRRSLLHPTWKILFL